jgi:hypothetical protein
MFSKQFIITFEYNNLAIERKEYKMGTQPLPDRLLLGVFVLYKESLRGREFLVT